MATNAKNAVSSSPSDALHGRILRMRRALQVLAIALQEPDGGSYHPARRFLTTNNVYHEDLQGTRVLLRVAEIGLGRRPTSKPKRTKYEECDRCDGVGWYEGGKTLKTTCERCHGTGKVVIA